MTNDNEAITAWLGTTSSQIFFMQLGFLCYEVGFVKDVWAPSVILKNIEDTFVGILTYLTFSHTFAQSEHSLFGIISIPENLLLTGIPASEHAMILTSAVFAITCATIVSGAVLERMKNKAYICWIFLIILINYSFISHWVWHPKGWLAQLGFMDGAGAIVIHSTGGVASLIAAYELGPRRNSMNELGELKKVEKASKPVVNAIGVFVLWYGWFAFNISSPVTVHASQDIHDAIGTAGLVTAVCPTASSCCALMLMYWGFADLSYDNILGALLAGLVAITGCCYTVGFLESLAIGFFVAPLYLCMSKVIRNSWNIDDPLQIIAVHFFAGLYSCLMEGIFANDTVNRPGLIHGGFKHFGVQILGTVVITAFNLIMCVFLWKIVLEKILFRHTPIRVSILDVYCGQKMFAMDNSMALEEILEVSGDLGRQMMFQFHRYTVDRFNDEQLDFLLCVKVFRDHIKSGTEVRILIKYAIQIINTYVLPDATRCVNLSGTQRARILRIQKHIQKELILLEKENPIDPENEKTKPAFISLQTYHSEPVKKKRISNTNGVATSPSMSNRSGRTTPRASSLPRLSGYGVLTVDKDLPNILDKLFDNSFEEVFNLVLIVFSQFLMLFDKKRDTVPYRVKLPFKVSEQWVLDWSGELDKIVGFHKCTSLSQEATKEYIEKELVDNDFVEINHAMRQSLDLTLMQPTTYSFEKNLEKENDDDDDDNNNVIKIKDPSFNDKIGILIT